MNENFMHCWNSTGNDKSLGNGYGKGRKMIENSYKTSCGCIHYFVNIIDKQKITLVFLPGLTADHRLFEKQIEYFEKKQNVFVWDAPSHALSRPFTNNYSLSGMAEWLYLH